jgi:hypothetical protein
MPSREGRQPPTQPRKKGTDRQIAVAGLIVAIIGSIAAVAVVPEFRCFVLHDCSPTPADSATATWEKNYDAMRQAAGMGSSAANECGYRNWTHRETFVGALNALNLTSAPDLSAIRDQLLATANNMPAKCGNDDWYNLAMSPAMADLLTKLQTGLRAKIIENHGRVPD